MAQLSFADLLVTGEHLTDELRMSGKANYQQILSLDIMRAEYAGAKFGIPVIFLPEVVRAFMEDETRVKTIMGPEGIPAAEHLLGLLWTHDVIPYHAYINTGPFCRAARVKEAFGWDRKTRFQGYWENDKFLQIKPTRSGVVASLFLRQDRALFVVMNDTDEDAAVELSPNWGALGLPPCQALVDAYAEQSAEAGAAPQTRTAVIPIVLDGATNTATFTVGRRNFRALAAR